MGKATTPRQIQKSKESPIINPASPDNVQFNMSYAIMLPERPGSAIFSRMPIRYLFFTLS